MISNARRRVLGAGFQRVILGDACITFFRTRNGLWGAIKPGALAGFVDGQRVKADLPRRNKPFQAYKRTRTNVVAAVARREGAALSSRFSMPIPRERLHRGLT